MPIYDYRCEANGRVVEVNHRMGVRPKTWGELCSMARLDPDGDTTPADAPVERVMTAAPMRLGGAAPAAQGCGSGCACHAPSLR